VDDDPSVLKDWLVHEYYLDTQRLTKMIIDAGPGKTFKADEIKTDTFKAHFQSTHWHYGQLCYATQAGVGYGNRIIENAYVTNDSLKGIVDQMAQYERDFFYGQSHVSKSDSGRYLVLEFYSERERRDVGFVYDPVGHSQDDTAGILTKYIRAQRTPGAESGWNDHDMFVQHKHEYEVTVQKPFKRYAGDNGEEIRSDTHTFALAAKKYNENELLAGHLSILFNRYEKGASGGATSIDYRLYRPVGGGKAPLFVWLHGADGARITDSVWTSGGFPDFLQNSGHIAIGSAGVLVSPAMQNKYGPFYVLAPQANRERDGMHNAEEIKKLIDSLIVQYPIDPSRIYIAGHSMGGMGTMNLLIAYPDFFAAAAPAPGSVGGFGGALITDEEAQALTETPLWLFAIRGDNTQMDNLTIRAYNTVRNAGGNNVRMTYFPVNAGKDDVFPFPGVPFGGPGYDYPGNYGYDDDPVLHPVKDGLSGYSAAGYLAGYDWSHSAYEPLISNTVTTNFKYNVGFTNMSAGNYSGAEDRDAHTNFQWDYLNPLDTAGDTVFDWMFKQQR
jgi:predicted peptidase